MSFYAALPEIGNEVCRMIGIEIDGEMQIKYEVCGKNMSQLA